MWPAGTAALAGAGIAADPDIGAALVGEAAGGAPAVGASGVAAGSAACALLSAACATCMVTMSVPAATSSPFFNSTVLTTPLTGDGTSIEAFSVSMVISGSSIRTVAPGLT